MDVHKPSTQIERLEVVETGRRRRWTDDEKLRIVLESMQTPRAISSTARWHFAFIADDVAARLPRRVHEP
jgi:transposase